MDSKITMQQQSGFCTGHFTAMASPCEILVDSQNIALSKKLTEIAAKEAWRIQDKFNRYDPQSQCSKINNSNGIAVSIDHETYGLLEFARQCYQMSEGQFDITSGVLRKVWTFDGSDKLPSNTAIAAILPKIGWPKVSYDDQSVTLPTGMEIDFGSIGKEYAVDKVVNLLRKAAPGLSIVVNFGGDLCVTTAKPNNKTWAIGIENPALSECANTNNPINTSTKAALTIRQGALATSGDARRFLLHNGKRYSHILNPKNGWPVADAPRSVTVAAPQCIQAGILATIALLQGSEAKAFLDIQGVKYWCFD